MRATMITGSLSHGGTTADVAGLAAFLCLQGHEVDVVALADDGPNETQLPRSCKCVRVYGGRNSPLSCARFLHHLSRLPSPDCILVTSDSYAAMLAAALYQRTTYLQRHHPRLVFLASSLSCERPIHLRSTATEILPGALARRITAMLVRSSTAIVVTGTDIERELRLRNGRYACDGKVSLMHHWCEDRPRPVLAKANHPLARKLNICGAFVVVHHGLYGCDHDVAALAQAIELTRTDQGIIWLFHGNGPQLEQLHRKHGDPKLSNVRYLPPSADVPLADLLHLGDAHVLSQGEHLTGTVSTPRLAQVMAAAKPVIVIAPDATDCAALVREHRAGMVVPSGRGEVLARCIWQLRDSPLQQQVLGRAGRLAYERQFSAAVIHPKLLSILQG